MSDIEIKNSLGDSIFKAVVGGIMLVVGGVITWLGIGLPDGRLLCVGPAHCWLDYIFSGLHTVANLMPFRN